MSKCEKLLIKFENMSDHKKVEVLESALSYMQQYNGRSRDECILLAMGATQREIDEL